MHFSTNVVMNYTDAETKVIKINTWFVVLNVCYSLKLHGLINLVNKYFLRYSAPWSHWYPNKCYRFVMLWKLTALQIHYQHTAGTLYWFNTMQVREASNDDPWGPSGTLMQEVARLTYQYTTYDEVMAMLWKRMFENKKNWRRIYKVCIDQLPFK